MGLGFRLEVLGSRLWCLGIRLFERKASEPVLKNVCKTRCKSLHSLRRGLKKEGLRFQGLLGV